MKALYHTLRQQGAGAPEVLPIKTGDSKKVTGPVADSRKPQDQTSSNPQTNTKKTDKGKPSPEEVKLAKSEGKSPAHIAAREKVARDYLENNGFTDEQINDAIGSPTGKPVGGIDLNKPVEVIQFPPPDTMTQYVRDHGRPGNWFDPLGNQTPDSLGINGDTRHLKKFKMPQGSGLKTHSRPILDSWTTPNSPVQTSGGGTQVIINDVFRKQVVGI